MCELYFIVYTIVNKEHAYIHSFGAALCTDNIVN